MVISLCPYAFAHTPSYPAQSPTLMAFLSLVAEGRGQVEDEGGEGANSTDGEEESTEVGGGLWRGFGGERG